MAVSTRNAPPTTKPPMSKDGMSSSSHSCTCFFQEGGSRWAKLSVMMALELGTNETKCNNTAGRDSQNTSELRFSVRAEQLRVADETTSPLKMPCDKLRNSTPAFGYSRTLSGHLNRTLDRMHGQLHEESFWTHAPFGRLDSRRLLGHMRPPHLRSRKGWTEGRWRLDESAGVAFCVCVL